VFDVVVSCFEDSVLIHENRKEYEFPDLSKQPNINTYRLLVYSVVVVIGSHWNVQKRWVRRTINLNNNQNTNDVHSWHTPKKILISIIVPAHQDNLCDMIKTMMNCFKDSILIHETRKDYEVHNMSKQPNISTYLLSVFSGVIVIGFHWHVQKWWVRRKKHQHNNQNTNDVH
jgi:hypothetical protein